MYLLDKEYFVTKFKKALRKSITNKNLTSITKQRVTEKKELLRRRAELVADIDKQIETLDQELQKECSHSNLHIEVKSVYSEDEWARLSWEYGRINIHCNDCGNKQYITTIHDGMVMEARSSDTYGKFIQENIYNNIVNNLVDNIKKEQDKRLKEFEKRVELEQLERLKEKYEGGRND